MVDPTLRRVLPARDLVRSLLDYDPETGEFRWRVRTVDSFPSLRIANGWNSRYARKLAGHIGRRGYVTIIITHWHCAAHRLAWMLMRGAVPHEIDHIDGNRANNRISNLRAATGSQNLANARVRRESASGIKGVYRRGAKFRAYIRVEGRTVIIGAFTTLQEAASARREAAERLYGEFARHE
jgi:hypothetical protein